MKVSHLKCVACGEAYAADELHQTCTRDGRPLEMVYDIAVPDPGWRPAPRPDMWRYAGLLPEVATPIDGLNPGWTPLIRWKDDGPETVWMKDEGRAHEGFGHNPTGSFKDRGMAMVGSMARAFGVSRIAIPTQGNAGDSLVAYATALGIEVAIALPEDTPGPILNRILEAARRYETVTAVTVKGTIREAGALVRERFLSNGYFSAATFSEPGWRIEGKKTLGLEIVEQLGWTFPDAIVYPTGGGTGILGMWKAFGELTARGLASGPLPRMIAVQSAATPPLVRACHEGAADTEACPAGETAATGLNVPYGIGHQRVLEILRESGGAAVSVGEDELARRSSLEANRGIGPEGAACLCALPELRTRGLIRSGDAVVVVNTCGPEKYR